MPELPEVETTVRDLQQKVLLRTFVDIWTDLEKFKKLKKELKNKKIKKVWRRGKNIIFELSQAPLEVNGSKKKHQENKPLTGQGYSLLVHQKLTGHLLYGKWQKDKVNSYIHFKFFLDNGKILALSDLRKFAKVELWKTEELEKELSSLGPEPLERDFTFDKFKEALQGKKGKTPRRTRGKIKQVLMNQEIIVGIGNIYSDEILWRVKIHPFRDVSTLTEDELKKIYGSLRDVLKKAIKLRGESISDYRDLEGRKGEFDKIRKVYRRENEKCSRCGTKIKRLKMGGRSAHFCPTCQKS